MAENFLAMDCSALTEYGRKLANAEYQRIAHVLGNESCAVVTGSTAKGTCSNSKLFYLTERPAGGDQEMWWRVAGCSDIDMILIYGDGTDEEKLARLMHEYGSEMSDQIVKTANGKQPLVKPCIELVPISKAGLDNFIEYLHDGKERLREIGNGSQSELFEAYKDRFLTEHLLHVSSVATVEDAYVLQDGNEPFRELQRRFRNALYDSEIQMMSGEAAGVKQYLQLLLEKGLSEGNGHPIVLKDFEWGARVFKRKNGLEAAARTDDVVGRLLKEYAPHYRDIELGATLTETAVMNGFDSAADLNLTEEEIKKIFKRIPTVEDVSARIADTKVRYSPEERIKCLMAEAGILVSV